MGTKKVLVIEDDESITELLKYNFTRNGFEAVTAYDGEKGLELARASRPNLAILDLMLPKIDGYEVLRQLKGNIVTEKMPVIILSAKVSPGAIIKGFGLGAADYVPKPFSIGELVAKVREKLEKEEKGGEKDNTALKNIRNNDCACDCVIQDIEKAEYTLFELISLKTAYCIAYGSGFAFYNRGLTDKRAENTKRRKL